MKLRGVAYLVGSRSITRSQRLRGDTLDKHAPY
ncbi:hypothetical protein C347_06884 [Cryptococcus neoformans AD2-60a]|nr:hypothetical protein C347_06884 [Cryptococcus neoformans var. grubii AD2-60a]